MSATPQKRKEPEQRKDALAEFAARVNRLRSMRFPVVAMLVLLSAYAGSVALAQRRAAIAGSGQSLANAATAVEQSQRSEKLNALLQTFAASAAAESPGDSAEELGELVGKLAVRTFKNGVATGGDASASTPANNNDAPQGGKPTPKSGGPASAKGLTIINPVNSGGAIRFLIDDQVVSLAPGESRTLPGETARKVRFHRGGTFGAAAYSLSAGRYQFQITQQGWTLTPERVD